MKYLHYVKAQIRIFLAEDMRFKAISIFGASVAVIIVVVGLILINSVFVYQSSIHLTGLRQPPLKTLAANHNIELGNFAIPSRISEAPYNYLLTSQLNLALLDNQPHWHFTRSEERRVG